MSMSKTSAESWIAAAARAYSRRFAALVTGFGRKYRDDFFLRTEVNIIALQVAYAILILLFCVGALIILYNDIVSGIVSAIATALVSTTTPLSTASLSLGL